MQRIPVSTWAQTGWYCCVQISGRGSLHVIRPVAGEGGGATGGDGGVGAGAFAGAAVCGWGTAASPDVPPGRGGRVVEHAANNEMTTSPSSSLPQDLVGTGSA